jgi:hypothetical protein
MTSVPTTEKNIYKYSVTILDPWVAILYERIEGEK